MNIIALYDKFTDVQRKVWSIIRITVKTSDMHGFIKYMPKKSKKLNLKKKINKKNKIIIEANKKNIKFEFVPKKFIENKLKNNISHQGVMLLVKPYPYFDKEKIFHKKCKLCIIINSIKDPINFGKIIRLSLAFSVDFIAVTKNKSTKISQNLPTFAKIC